MLPTEGITGLLRKMFIVELENTAYLVGNILINLFITPLCVAAIFSAMEIETPKDYMKYFYELPFYFSLCFCVNVITMLISDYYSDRSIDEFRAVINESKREENDKKVFITFIRKCGLSWLIALRYYRLNSGGEDVSNIKKYKYYLFVFLATFFNHIFYTPLSMVILFAMSNFYEMVVYLNKWFDFS